METIHAFLIVWALTNGAGTVTITPQPSMAECELAGANRIDTSTTADCTTLEDAKWHLGALGMAYCHVAVQDSTAQIWQCTGWRK